MKWKYVFKRYMRQIEGFMAFEYGVTVEIEDPYEAKTYFATGRNNPEGYTVLNGSVEDVTNQLNGYHPGVVSEQIAEGLAAYCKGSVEDLEEAVGVVMSEKVGYFGEEPLGVEV